MIDNNISSIIFNKVQVIKKKNNNKIKKPNMYKGI